MQRPISVDEDAAGVQKTFGNRIPGGALILKPAFKYLPSGEERQRKRGRKGTSPIERASANQRRAPPERTPAEETEKSSPHPLATVSFPAGSDEFLCFIRVSFVDGSAI